MFLKLLFGLKIIINSINSYFHNKGIRYSIIGHYCFWLAPNSNEETMQRPTTTTQQKSKYCIVLNQSSAPMPSLFSLILALLLLLMFYLLSRVFTEATTNAIDACAEENRDRGTMGTSYPISFFFLSFLFLPLLPDYLLYREVGFDWRHSKRKRFNQG